MELTVLIPCLNEEKTVGACVEEALRGIQLSGVDGEVLVVDNGSTDRSVSIAQTSGARVVLEEQKGYGSALRRGIREAKGRYIVMGDSDGSYDFLRIKDFLPKLHEGYDLVMGNRFTGGIEPGAMRPLHKLGNPILTAALNILFGTRIGDAHCGMRAFNTITARSWDLQTLGMEFASEIVVKAKLHGARITEIPFPLRKDARDKASHLRSFRDGWRHLRYLLLMSPSWVMAVPATLLLVLGIGLMLWLTPGAQTVGHIRFDVNMMIFGAMCTAVGYQTMLLWVCAKIFGWRTHLVPSTRHSATLIRGATLERGLILGTVFFIAGLIVSALLLRQWSLVGFGELHIEIALRYALWGLLLIMLGIQTISHSFFLGFLMFHVSSDDREELVKNS